uniref:Photosystem I assembly protein Ycf12 n=1 Tax=Mallomonas splendens TaxID=52552 RepID=A0A3G2QZG7_9STRA|nr:photosystem I assembly protein Ycf12 [Mallomonas splendens]AYO28530.1 photosystem I assembly protein Ycf12 [Mallomonas splendens]
MNLNVIGQLISTFLILSIGPAVIAYLAYKKAL